MAAKKTAPRKKPAPAKPEKLMPIREKLKAANARVGLANKELRSAKQIVDRLKAVKKK